MTICESSVVRIPTTRSRVDWGLGLVILSFSPTIRLRRVDFPTFGLPATVTIPALVIGKKIVACAPVPGGKGLFLWEYSVVPGGCHRNPGDAGPPRYSCVSAPKLPA